MSDHGPWLRRARKEHRCTEASYHAIRPGDLYLHAVCPPWHDVNDTRKFWVIRACLHCADRHGMHTSDTRKQLENARAADIGPPARAG